MHNYAIEYAKIYRSDIIQLLDYIKEDNILAAIEFNEKIDKAISTLSEFPFKGSIPNDPQIRLRGYRMLIINGYIIFYIPSIIEEKIKVYRILSAKQNYIEFL